MPLSYNKNQNKNRPLPTYCISRKYGFCKVPSPYIKRI